MAGVLGMGVVQTLPRLPLPGEMWTLCAAITVAMVAAVVVVKRRVRVTLCVVIAVLIGMAYASVRAEARMQQVLPGALDGVNMTMQGRIVSLPQRLVGMAGGEGWRFIVEVSSGAANLSRGQPRPMRLLVSCYQMPSPPRADERWQLTLKLRRPHGLMNPHGWDQALWMLEQDLPAAASCRSQGMKRLEPAGWSLHGLRQSLRDAIDQQVPDARSGGVLTALSLGDQGAVSAADWRLYRETGVAHLLSVSGLHVTMFAWLAATGAGAVWRRSARLCLRCPAPRAGLWIGVAAATAYALFSGWGVPAQRTVGLLLILALVRQAGAQWPWSLSLAVAALGVSAVDPWALVQPGFWLSFCAVALLMASDQPTVPGWRGTVQAALRSQWVITLGLAPLTLVLFQQFSVVGVVANAVAIPWVSYVITPLAMAGALWSPLWTVGAWMVSGLNAWLGWLQQWPMAVWHLPWAPAWAQALGLAGGLCLALPWARRWRSCGAALCVPMLWPALERPPPGHMAVWIPDVGQGGAAVIRTHRHTVLFDAGPRWGPQSDAGQRVLLPLLRGLGERQVDLMMVSHADQDHAGGAGSIVGGLPVIWGFGAVDGGAPCQRGQRWWWDGVRFTVLWPDSPASPTPTPTPYQPLALRQQTAPPSQPRRNSASCVLQVEAAGRRILLTADIEAAQETQLLRRDGEPVLQSEVIVVPHHGSRTSSSKPFVAAVGADVALIQAGHLNRFGHPRPDVVARYADHGATVLTTIGCGAWQWRSDGREPALSGCERRVRRRYWLTPATALAGTASEEEPESRHEFGAEPPY